MQLTFNHQTCQFGHIRCMEQDTQTMLHLFNVSISHCFFRFKKLFSTYYFETVLLSSSDLKDERPHILPGTMTPFIVSTSFGFEYPRPLLPLFHYIGPIIKNENTHPLQEGPLKKWLDSKSNASVILISMGTQTNRSLFASDCVSLTNSILATPYSSLWSLKDLDLQELVHKVAGHQNEHQFFLSNWIPQQTAARHRSIGLAIFHGGIGGVSQCLYNGISEIIIPYALDRDDVAGLSVEELV